MRNSPKFKKSFVEFNYLEKELDNKTIRVIRELVWRSGEINVQIEEQELNNFNNVEELFKSLQKHHTLLINDEFPYEYEFLSSYDGCLDDYSISYTDGSNVENKLENEILNIINEEGIDELEDNHGFSMIDTKYELCGELDIVKNN